MTYRMCRKFKSSTFRVGDQLCKIFLEPKFEYRPGFFLWNAGFAIGNSRRQLNDWYWRRKNKRARSLNKKLVGKSGLKAISIGFEKVLKLRWIIAPGDAIVFDCTSGDSERQFRAWMRWAKYYPELAINSEKKEFTWYRPPYADDPIRKYFDIKPITPADPRANTSSHRYSDCFLLRPKGSSGSYQSTSEIIDLLSQAQANV